MLRGWDPETGLVDLYGEEGKPAPSFQQARKGPHEEKSLQAPWSWPEELEICKARRV